MAGACRPGGGRHPGVRRFGRPTTGCLALAGEIGEEVHHDVDQVLVFVEGEGVAVLEGQRSPVPPGRLVHVPAGMRHNFVNEGSVDLKLYTVYTAPKHAPGTIHRTKAEADADEKHA